MSLDNCSDMHYLLFTVYNVLKLHNHAQISITFQRYVVMFQTKILWLLYRIVTCMHSHKDNTSMATDWYNVSDRSQIKYLGHVPNECTHAPI